MPEFTDENGIVHPAEFDWASNGVDTLLDANNDGVHGLVTGSYEQYEGFIDLLGHISINGLEDELSNIKKNASLLSDEINTEKESRLQSFESLKNDTNEQIEKLGETDKQLQENINEFKTSIENSYETKTDAAQTKLNLTNTIAANREISFKYQGEYINGNTYAENDVVHFGKYYYLSLVDVNQDIPDITKDTTS